MIVTIHQPEHFPYMGFFQKMSSADLFVVLDDVKFKKNDFQNRNRFLNRSGHDEWFTVPVEKDANSKLIKDVVVSKDVHWRSSVKKQIFFNLKYDMSEVYDTGEKLIDINLASIEWCRKKLGIKTDMVMSSNISEKQGSKSELLLAICKQIGAKKYISGSGGRDYLDVEIFKDAGIEVEFFTPRVENYYSSLYNILTKH
jgi:hypothetical protein